MKLTIQFTIFFLCILLTSSCSYLTNPQQADESFIPSNNHKTFLNDHRPLVYIDEAHYNFHTTDGRYSPFVKVLKSDGYLVNTNKKEFTLESLESADILVIANALSKKNEGTNGELPNYPAFKSEEVAAVHEWVSNGGSLFLIADHMPWPKASEQLALAFGFKFNNGHGIDPENRKSIYGVKKGDLTNHAITKGINNNYEMAAFGNQAFEMPKNMANSDNVNKVRTFGGQAFEIPSNAVSLLTFGQSSYSAMPSIPFNINKNTPKVSVGGWSQGAVLDVGKGRIAVFGEACMFSAQIDINSQAKCGFLADGAAENEQFLLNIMHWLSRLL